MKRLATSNIQSLQQAMAECKVDTMTVDQLGALLRIEAQFTGLLEELRTVIAVALVDVQRDELEPDRPKSFEEVLTATE